MGIAFLKFSSFYVRGDRATLIIFKQRLKKEIMKIKDIDISLEKIKPFCERWQVIELAIFGSVLRDDFRPDSDIDVMVKFDINAHPTFLSLEEMEAELKTILNREVDLITRSGIENSRNYLRRQEILSSARVIYAKRSSISA